MATLADLWTLMDDAALKQKVSSACIIAADAIRSENVTTTNHVNRLKWAKSVMIDHVGAGAKMLKAVLAANNTLTLAQITAATDVGIQTAVNNAVDVFADGS